MRALLIDHDERMRVTLAEALEQNGFAVTCASTVVDALNHINTNTYDLLLSDLPTPEAGEGFTVVRAMQQANPSAVSLLLNGFPQMKVAAHNILKANGVLVRPIDVAFRVDGIEQLSVEAVGNCPGESIAAILERTTEAAIQEWYRRIERTEMVMSVAMSREMRCVHLPQLFRDLVSRLSSSRKIGSNLGSFAAARHGRVRRQLGYSAAMLVEESRVLQVSIFQTLQNNLDSIDYSQLLLAIMTIADEVDSQLSQAMTAYVKESMLDRRAD